MTEAPDVCRIPLALTLLGAAALAGCGDDLPRRDVAFDTVFHRETTVELQRDTTDPVVDVTALAVRPDGGYLVVDGPAGRVRAFDSGGRREGILGAPGEGPGELRQPSAAAVGPGGEVLVVQRGGPRVTVYHGRDSTRSFPLPGHYGHWIAPLGDRLAVGIGTRGNRFAVLTATGDTVATFGPRRPDPARYPAGPFVFDDHAAVAGETVLVNTSFSPEVRVHGDGGDSLRSFGTPPASWRPPEPLSGAGGGVETPDEVRDWLRGGTVVTALAAVGDSLVAVQYGRYEPTPDRDERLVPTTLDVYRLDGTKLYEGIPLDRPILSGGDRLHLLADEPPGPWTISVHALRPAGE